MKRKKLLAKEQIKDYTDIVYLDHEELPKYKGKWREQNSKHQIPNTKLYLELGMGKGRFITTLAEKHPNHLYLGLEVKEERTLSAAKKIQEKKLSNIRLLCCNLSLLPEIFESEELDGIYINFPDPWPKKRHTKRRMTQTNQLSIYKKLLKPDGFIQLKHDNPDFFEFSKESLSVNGWKFTESIIHPNDKNNIETEYEERWRKAGRDVYSLITTAKPTA